MFFLFLLFINIFLEEKIGNQNLKEQFIDKSDYAIFLVKTKENYNYLKNKNLKPLAYISGYYLLKISKNIWEDLYKDKKIISLRPFKKEWKINTEKRIGCFRYLKLEKENLNTHRICFKDEREFYKFLEGEDILYIEGDWEIVLRNDKTSWVIQSNIENFYPFYEENIKGEGEIVGHIDSPIYLNSCYFKDENNPIGPQHRKIVAYRSPNLTDKDIHGTHTGGTICGESEGKPNNGIAPKAKLSYTNILYIQGFREEDSNLYNYLKEAHKDGARIHSNSWGDDSTTQYTTLCYDIDKFSYDYPEDLIIFSVTNLQNLKTPENAKNLIGVGSTLQAPNQDRICTGGKGPTIDGRIKPDIFVPGCNINSASSTSECGTISLSGTSMAAPAISGASALIRNYLKDKREFISNSLIKAIILNSGEDLISIPDYPNFQEGWGRLNLSKSINFGENSYELLIEDFKKEEGLKEGEEKIFKILVSSSNFPLKVTLVWTDFPAIPSSRNILINDLNLSVMTPSGIIFKGNNIKEGISQEGGEWDNKNNVERVIIPFPEEGIYEIRVEGFKIPMPSQSFSLVATGAISKSYNYYLPIIAKKGGANETFWKTSLWINNTEDFPIELKLKYYNYEEYEKEIILQAKETIFEEDPLLNWFSIEEGAGPLLIESLGVLKCYANIYNNSINGTYGQSYKAFSSSFEKGEVLIFTGLSQKDEKRTNFGVSNYGEEVSELFLYLYDNLGNLVGENNIYINSHKNMQWNLTNLFPFLSILNNGSLIVKINKGSKIIPYVSVITNTSGDGIFISPSNSRGEEKIIPVLAGSKNPTGFPWKTELFIFSEEEKEFLGSFRVLQNQNWEEISLKYKINSYNTLSFYNFFEELNLSEGFGFLTFNGNFNILTRIYSGETIDKSYGQFIPPFPIKSAKAKHYLPSTMPNENFRINLGFSNPFENDIFCNVSLYRGKNEKLEEKILGVEQKSLIQYPLSTIFPNMPFGEPLLLKLECDGNLFVYASLIDGRTSDGSFFADF